MGHGPLAAQRGSLFSSARGAWLTCRRRGLTPALSTICPVGGEPLPSTAQVAFQQSDVLAWNLWASLTRGPKLLRFRYTALGEMLTLGSTDASIFGLDGLFKLDGMPASLARRMVRGERRNSSHAYSQAHGALAAIAYSHNCRSPLSTWRHGRALTFAHCRCTTGCWSGVCAADADEHAAGPSRRVVGADSPGEHLQRGQEDPRLVVGADFCCTMPAPA
jgi:hypothetical protein